MKADRMSIIYQNNEQIIIEMKKLMLEKKMTQRQIANILGLTPQGLVKLLNKKNFGFEDAKRILNAIGCELVMDFQNAGEVI